MALPKAEGIGRSSRPAKGAKPSSQTTSKKTGAKADKAAANKDADRAYSEAKEKAWEAAKKDYARKAPASAPRPTIVRGEEDERRAKAAPSAANKAPAGQANRAQSKADGVPPAKTAPAAPAQ